MACKETHINYTHQDDIVEGMIVQDKCLRWRRRFDTGLDTRFGGNTDNTVRYCKSSCSKSHTMMQECQGHVHPHMAQLCHQQRTTLELQIRLQTTISALIVLSILTGESCDLVLCSEWPSFTVGINFCDDEFIFCMGKSIG